MQGKMAEIRISQKYKGYLDTLMRFSFGFLAAELLFFLYITFVSKYELDASDYMRFTAASWTSVALLCPENKIELGALSTLVVNFNVIYQYGFPHLFDGAASNLPNFHKQLIKVYVVVSLIVAKILLLRRR